MILTILPNSDSVGSPITNLRIRTVASFRKASSKNGASISPCLFVQKPFWSHTWALGWNVNLRCHEGHWVRSRPKIVAKSTALPQHAKCQAGIGVLPASKKSMPFEASSFKGNWDQHLAQHIKIANILEISISFIIFSPISGCLFRF